MNTVDEIKNRLDIVDIVSENVRLRKSGKSYTGFCPFHANTRTPAFVVFPDTGTWRCFGECNEGGDIFRYVMKREGWDFKEALKYLAERAGVRLEPLTPQRKEQNERSEHLRKLLEDAVTFYRSQLLSTDPGRQALSYLVEKRGISENTAEVWGIGYAPQSWDATLNYLISKGYTRQDILDAGMVSERDNGSGVYDKFRHRLMFPIRDASDGMVGFGGRILDPDDVPKFMNSPQTILFDKSRLLYGLNRARKAIRTAGEAVIVEGYMDVVVVHQQGFENIVSPMGTALTEPQLRSLKRYARRFVLALDPDAAGIKATLRGLEVARESLDRTDDLVFDARGLLHNEARLQADLRVSTLPDDLDPDEIVLRDPEEWQHIIEAAKPIIFHVLDTLIEGQDISDPKVKSDIAARILPLIKDVPNPVERDAYRQQVARVLQVDESALMLLSGPAIRPQRRRRIPVEQREQPITPRLLENGSHEKIKAMELEVLSYLVREPEQQHRVSRYLHQEGLAPFTARDFSLTENQQAFEVIANAVRQDQVEPRQFILENLPDELDFILESAESQPPVEGSSDPDKSKAELAMRELEETIRLVMQLRQLSVNAQIKELRFLQADTEEPEDKKDTLVWLNNLNQLIQLRGKLDKALSGPILLA